jgi:hypothetical protein
LFFDKFHHLLSVNLTRCLIFLTLATAGLVNAEPPKQMPAIKYKKLWEESPFTVKPEGSIAQTINPLEDYVLLGLSPIPSGYRATMLNKKKPTDPRIYVESNKSNELGFSIVDVIRKDGDPLGTVVRMKSGSTTGLVGFDDKFLKLAVAAPPNIPPPNAAVVSGGAPVAPQDPKAAPVKTPRPRIIQPPVTGQPAGQNAPNMGGQNNPSRAPGRPPVTHHTR